MTEKNPASADCNDMHCASTATREFSDACAEAAQVAEAGGDATAMQGARPQGIRLAAERDVAALDSDAGAATTEILPSAAYAGEALSTASDTFALACERTAIAAEEERDRERAVRTLDASAADATARLDAGTRSGGTRALPEALRAALDEGSAQSEAQATDARTAKARPTRRRRAIIAACVAALGVVAAVMLYLGGFFSSGVDEASVRAALEADASFMQGFASNEYVEPSDYELSDVRIVHAQQEADGSVTADVAATLANKSFESDCLLTMSFARAKDAANHAELADAPDTGKAWVGAIVHKSATTKAIAPVTVDGDFPDGFKASFDEGKQECAYTSERTFDLWFGKSTVSMPYTYTFDGSAWVRTGETAGYRVDLYDASALEGAYDAQDGDAAQVLSFAIGNVDARTGAFTVEYEVRAPGFTGATVYGVVDCTISQDAPADGDTDGNRQADGCVYRVEGEGTSSDGGGTSMLTGTLGFDGRLSVTLTVDYRTQPFLFGEAADKTMELSVTLRHE